MTGKLIVIHGDKTFTHFQMNDGCYDRLGDEILDFITRKNYQDENRIEYLRDKFDSVTQIYRYAPDRTKSEHKLYIFIHNLLTGLRGNTYLKTSLNQSYMCGLSKRKDKEDGSLDINKVYTNIINTSFTKNARCNNYYILDLNKEVFSFFDFACKNGKMVTMYIKNLPSSFSNYFGNRDKYSFVQYIKRVQEKKINPPKEVEIGGVTYQLKTEEDQTNDMT
jgi:hypothetical protein